MSDIFISYASEDKKKAGLLAEVLEEQGWSVWWDRTIPTGRKFDEVIDEALREARSIVVLWSRVSITKDWVLEEAEEGREKGILIPVFIENVKPPRGFRRYQAADLSDWDGRTTAPAFQKLVTDIAAILGPPSSEAKHAEREAGADGKHKKPEEKRLAQEGKRGLQKYQAHKKTTRLPTSSQVTRRFMVGNRIIVLYQGDITDLSADVIVSSDDNNLSMAGGVSARIREIAGPIVVGEARHLAPLGLGEIGVTLAGELQAKMIFHGVVLDYDHNKGPSEQVLGKVIDACFRKANEHWFRSIALPLLGSGAGGLPVDVTLEVILSLLIRKFARCDCSIEIVTVTIHSNTIEWPEVDGVVRKLIHRLGLRTKKMRVLTRSSKITCDHITGKVRLPRPTGGADLLTEKDLTRRTVDGCASRGASIKPCTYTQRLISGLSDDLRGPDNSRVVLETVDALTDGTPPGEVHIKVGSDQAIEVEVLDGIEMQEETQNLFNRD